MPEDDYLTPLGKAAVKRPGKDLTVVTGPDIPVPASPPLEKFYIPDETDFIQAAREILITNQNPLR